MRRLMTASAAFLALTALTAPLRAETACITPGEMVALRTAAIQQQLMVAALTCHDITAYNSFVQAYRPELQHADVELKKYFVKRVGAHGEAASDTFKTKLANLSSLSTLKNGAAYCSNADAAFASMVRTKQSLDSFVADQRLMIALPEESVCSENKVLEAKLETPHVRSDIKPDVKVEIARAKPLDVKLDAVRARPPVRLASATPAEAAPVRVRTVAVIGVPAHDLPATPFGAAEAPARSYPAAQPRVALARAETTDAQTVMQPVNRPGAGRASVMRDYLDENAPPPPRPSQRLIEAARAQYGYGMAASYAPQRGQNNWSLRDQDNYADNR